LENEPDPLPPEAGQLIAGTVGKRLAEYKYFTRGGRIQAANEVEKCGLPGPRAPAQRAQGAFGHLQSHVFQGSYPGGADRVSPADGPDRDDRFWGAAGVVR